MKRLFFVVMMVTAALRTYACTNLIVGKNASTDGSAIVSYSFDQYDYFGRLSVYPAATYPQGTMRNIYEMENDKYLGQIAEAEQTYHVVDHMNEFQLTITESTLIGRLELVDRQTGILDYGSLMTIALQRSRTAREAIKVMTDLVAEYGFCSMGETFTLVDPNEIWLMEMIGKGPGGHGAVWVAVRIPDDCIAAHSNHSRIHQFPLNDPENCVYSSDVISFAREKGFFDGKDKDFSFSKAYGAKDHLALRINENRVWSFYNRYTDNGEKYLPYLLGESDEPMPLYEKPNTKLSVRDIQEMMRDHYEGTVFDPTHTFGSGPYHTPYRAHPIPFAVDGTEYFHERGISTQQSAWVIVAQVRGDLPNEVGGVIWYGQDDANTTVFTPVYCCATSAPECYDTKEADRLTFSWNSAYWVYNWVTSMVYPRYDLMIDDLRKVQRKLEDGFALSQPAIEQTAVELLKTDRDAAVEYLTNYGKMMASSTMDAWKQLGTYLVVKYTDMVVAKEKDGKFERDEAGHPAIPELRGYSQEYKEEFAKQATPLNTVPQKYTGVRQGVLDP